MASQTNNIEKYAFATEYSQEDIKKVIKLEIEEQERRINDKEGETKRRVVAHEVSELFGESLRATWFQSGSSFVLHLLGSVRSAGKQVLKSQPAQVLNSKIQHVADAATQKAGEIGLQAQHAADNLVAKGISSAEEIKDKSVSAAIDIKDKSIATALSLNTQVQQKAGELGEKAQHTAEDLAAKSLASADKSINTAQSVAHDIKDKSISTAQDLSSKTQGAAIHAKDTIVEKVSEFALGLKSAISSMSLFQRIGNLTGNTNMTYAHLEMEKERAFRISGANEYNSIQNAKKVAALIKDLSSLYRPASEPFAHYHTRLLEEAERSRRITEAQSDKAAVSNARAASSLISGEGASTNLLQAQFTEVAEESERARRMELAQKDKAAVDNARTVSNLVKEGLASRPASAAM